MYFSINISLIPLILLGCTLTMGVLVWIIYLLRVRSVSRARVEADTLREADKPEEYSPASIVIYSQG
ncbi:MAG: hypothetical protein K2F99_09195, partial [Muribaculaceae bacterium]|nr:hypothetical protein [Muribaculaceae bacterium]